MVEIKGENMINHPAVKAKQEYAEMIDKTSDVDMSYEQKHSFPGVNFWVR